MSSHSYLTLIITLLKRYITIQKSGVLLEPELLKRFTGTSCLPRTVNAADTREAKPDYSATGGEWQGVDLISVWTVSDTLEDLVPSMVPKSNLLPR